MRYLTAKLPGGITEIFLSDPDKLEHDIKCYVTPEPGYMYYSTLQEAIDVMKHYLQVKIAGYRKECQNKRNSVRQLQHLTDLSKAIELYGEESEWIKIHKESTL